MKTLRWTALVALSACIDWNSAYQTGCTNAGLCGNDGGNGGSGGFGGGDAGTAGGSGGGVVLEDAGIDAGTDAGTDAGFDAGVCSGICVADGGEPGHAIPACIAGTCALACEPLWGDCDDGGFSAAGNGCEFGLDSDTNNCGACGSRCDNAHTTAVGCNGGRCVFTCSTGFGDCDGRGDNGCEANLNADPGNCGVCGFSCGDGGIACSAPGVCRFSTSESLQADQGFNALVADRTSLYWVNSNPRVVRRVEKNGTGLRSLSDAGMPLDNLRPGLIAVDLDYAYVFNGGGGTAFRLNKSGLQTATLLPAATTFGGPSSLYADGNGVARSRWLVHTQVANGPGALRIDLDAGMTGRISNTGDATGGVLINGRFYYHASTNQGSAPHSIHFADYGAAMPISTDMELISMGTVNVGGMAHDGTFLYVYGSDNNVYRISSTGSSTVMGTCSMANGIYTRIAVDGPTLYIAGAGVYRLPLDGGATTQCQPLTAQNNTNGLVVDSDALYVGTNTDVFRMHK